MLLNGLHFIKRGDLKLTDQRNFGININTDCFYINHEIKRVTHTEGKYFKHFQQRVFAII